MYARAQSGLLGNVYYFILEMRFGALQDRRAGFLLSLHFCIIVVVLLLLYG